MQHKKMNDQKVKSNEGKKNNQQQNQEESDKCVQFG
jgi:hypothetical protein